MCARVEAARAPSGYGAMREPLPPELVELAARILAWEAAQPGAERSPPIKLAVDRLQAHMMNLVGAAGFHALVRRAVHLAKREHASLGYAIETGSLGAREPPVPAVAPEMSASEGPRALLAHLLYLFCTFIGEDLTMLQVRRAWGDPRVVEEPGAASKETKSWANE